MDKLYFSLWRSFFSLLVYLWILLMMLNGFCLLCLFGYRGVCLICLIVFIFWGELNIFNCWIFLFWCMCLNFFLRVFRWLCGIWILNFWCGLFLFWLWYVLVLIKKIKVIVRVWYFLVRVIKWVWFFVFILVVLMIVSCWVVRCFFVMNFIRLKVLVVVFWFDLLLDMILW